VIEAKSAGPAGGQKKKPDKGAAGRSHVQTMSLNKNECINFYLI
jgi:hypothetical protein